MHFADGVICPVTFAMHLAAAVPTRSDMSRVRPCVVIAGGREPAHWEAYPGHQFISTNGTLPCCQSGGCWKSRCQLVGDGDPKDRHDVCERPVQIRPDLRIAECLHRITAGDVIRCIEAYYEGGVLAYTANGNAQRKHLMPTETGMQTADITPKSNRTNVLIKFRHGLGDAVQLTTVLQHLTRVRPDWDVDVAALVGKHSAFRNLCRSVFVLDRDGIDQSAYERVMDLEWSECARCYADSPSTKAERCLREQFGIEPLSDSWGYEIHPTDEDHELARRYFERDLRVTATGGGRYPVVLIHYEGNTSAGEKNLSVSLVAVVCEQIIKCGAIPVILDWDHRSPLPDGKRIFNPNPDLELWRGCGTGDAGVLAALIERAALKRPRLSGSRRNARENHSMRMFRAGMVPASLLPQGLYPLAAMPTFAGIFSALGERTRTRAARKKCI
jgi:hypothetical protein